MIGSTSDDKADKVAVGNVIGEGHANYVLMYNMLTGIRIGVRGAPFILVLDAHSTDRYPAVRPR